MRPSSAKQDRFFLWGMVFLPIFSLSAYIFDAYFYYYNAMNESTGILYEGLLSTIFIVFAYLQYCAPIESRYLRCAYYVLLGVLVEVGHVGYLLAYIHKGNLFSIAVFVGWMTLDIISTSALIYCRVYREYDHFIEVENKHIFHFISRLEVILAIFIPVFISKEYSTVTRDNIAFFLLFDFFSETYERFKGVWIKSVLYVFVAVVTVSVATEWLYFSFKDHTFEQISEISELAAACLCNVLIIMQFLSRHFKEESSSNNAELVQIIVADDKSIVNRF